MMKTSTLFIAMTLLISACGGGGSSDNGISDDGSNTGNNGNNGNSGNSGNSDGFNNVVPEESLALNRDNANKVAQHIAQVVLDVEDLASAVNIAVISNATGSGSSRVRSVTPALQNSQQRRISTIGECESGSVTSSDDMHLNFNDCEYSNSLYNGNVNVNLFNNGKPEAGGEFIYAGDGVADNFTITQRNRTVHIDGEFDISNSSKPDTELPGSSVISLDGIVEDTPLYLNEDGETTRVAGRYSFDFTALTETSAPIHYSQNISARIASTSLDGQVSVSSNGFSGTDNGFPDSGTLTVNGANGSEVELEVLNADTVQISVDANGDDDFDDTEDSIEVMTWRAFLGL